MMTTDPVALADRLEHKRCGRPDCDAARQQAAALLRSQAERLIANDQELIESGKTMTDAAAAIESLQERLAATEAVMQRFCDGFKPVLQRDGRLFWHIPDSPHFFDIQPMSEAERQTLGRLDERREP